MREEYYPILRKFFFWVFTLAFIIFSPFIVYYSLGYKFDIAQKQFLKTGALSVKTVPRGATIYLNGNKLEDTAPCIIRELLPRQYSLMLEREGYYPYQIPIEIRPAFIYDIDVVLVPKMQDREKIRYDFNVYKFFISKRFFNEKIIAFTDKGIYLLDDDLKIVKRLFASALNEEDAMSLEGLKESNNRIVFWNKNNIWILGVPLASNKSIEFFSNLYKAEEDIKDVFFGLHDRYLLIHDGLKVVALDVDNPKVTFSIMELKSLHSRIYYDVRTETLFVRDKVPQTNSFSLFKIELMPFLPERKEIFKDSKKPR